MKQSLGNHEFDDGIDGLLPFLDAVNFPVLASNIQTDREPEMVGKTAKSVVIEVGGRKIGIIGYTYPEAQVNTMPLKPWGDGNPYKKTFLIKKNLI